jgi:hypothetical protein
MNLLVVYVVSLLVAQTLAVGAGLIVDRLYSSYGGLVVFIALYFAMFWVAWKFAVRVTEPKSTDAPSSTPGPVAS